MVLGAAALAALDAPYISTSPKIREDNVLAPVNGIYRRCLVLDGDGQKFTVGAIDTGESGIVSFNTIKAMPKTLRNTQRYTFMIKLKGVVRQPTANKKNVMKAHLESIRSITCRIVGDRKFIIVKDPVELFDANDSINIRLNSIIIKRFYTSDLPSNVLIDKISTKLPTVITIASNFIAASIFGFMCVEDLDLFRQIQLDVQSYGTSVDMTVYRSYIDELCVVKVGRGISANFWLRAVFKGERSGHGKQALVFLIDYQMYKHVLLENIRVKIINTLPLSLNLFENNL